MISCSLREVYEPAFVRLKYKLMLQEGNGNARDSCALACQGLNIQKNKRNLEIGKIYKLQQFEVKYILQ